MGGANSHREPPAEVTVVVGTRPELIKMSPVVRSVLDSDILELRLIHTGQHYDDALSDSFFRTLGLPTPDMHLGVGSQTHGAQTAEALREIESDIHDRDPAVILAQGDTNAVLSAALATSKTDSLSGHVEAGIRSYDRTMPEETNRVVADHVSDLLFAPTAAAVDNLAAEGIESGVHETGNTVVDACQEHRGIAVRESDILERLNVAPNEYVTATIHRPRNTDEPGRLRHIVTAFDDAPCPVVLPAHPRTRSALDSIGFEPSGTLRLLEPLGYLDFLRLLEGGRAVVTDSGGIQEEASILGVPCLTVRPNTERPETIEAGINRLVEPAALADELRVVFGSGVERMDDAAHLYGDGTAGRRIAELVEQAVLDAMAA